MQPLLGTWNGTGVDIEPRQLKHCDKHLVVGERYIVDINHARSPQSHNHYFAALTEAWRNLPEKLAALFPTVEHLRKRALIMTGYRTERIEVRPTARDAENYAAGIKDTDEFVVVEVTGNVVRILTAMSQGHRAMTRRDFQDSKAAVLNYVADLIQVEVDKLSANAGRAA